MLMETLLIAIATCLLFIVVSKFKYWINNAGNSAPEPPGPFQWPIVGNLVLFQRLSRKHGGQHRAFLELSRLYSSNFISLRLGRSKVIAVSGYREIKMIFGGDQFDGRPWNEFSKLRNMGLRKGITMSDGPEWREVRAWLVRTLRKVGFGRAEMSACMNEELELVLDGAKDGGIYRIRKLLAPAMINVIWTLATGKRIADKEKLDNFIQLMERRAKAFDMAGGILSLFPWLRHIAPEASGYKLLVTLNNEIKALLMTAIEEHKDHQNAVGAISGHPPEDLIYAFFEEMNNNGNKGIFNEDQLFMILLDLLIAGAVTTTTTLDFLFLRMTVHQDVQRKLHEELDSVIGHDRLVNLNDRPNLPYVEAVLTESQRMQMVAPIVGPRRATRDSNVDGYRIPEGTCVLVNVWSVHMNPEYYPNPDTFDPERFIKDGSYVPDEKLIFFGRGHRRCPCEADARSALFIFFVGIMQRFQLLPKPGEKAPETDPNFGMTISPKPYEILLVPR